MMRPCHLATATLIGTAATLFGIPTSLAFLAPSSTVSRLSPQTVTTHQRSNEPALLMASDAFELTVDLPGGDLSAQMKFQPVLDVPSEIFQVRYKLPFGLDVAPQKNFAVCTKDGPGGEKVGDVLRYTSQWTLGLPRGDGVVTTAMSFSGGISWQCSMFDVMRAGRWEDVVEALTSNVPGRTDEVVLIFERPLPEGKE